MTTPETWCSASTSEAAGPADGRSGVIRLTPSALCSMGWRPLMITGLLRDVLLRHFAGPVEESDLRHLVWRPDERTGILIESIYRWRGDAVGKRPAVIIKPNGRRNLRLTIADKAGATEQGFQKFRTWWVGTHTVFCIHGKGAATDILATEVQRQLTQFANVLVTYLNLETFRVTDLGGIAELEEDRESFVIPITVAWAYQEAWQVELESLKLRRVPIDLILDGAVIQTIE